MVHETRVLPALAVRGVVPIPNNDFRIEVGREMSIKALEEAEKNYGKFVILMVQKNPLINAPTPDDIERYAVVARMTMKIKIPNDNYKVKFNIINRVEIVGFNQETDFFSVNYQDAEVVYGEVDETLTLVKMVINEITKDPNVANDGTHLLEKLETETPPEKLADIIAFNLKINEADKYRYLEEKNLNQRFKYILEDISKQKMIIDLEKKINDEVRKSIDESQKEYYLREKMKAIQNELGDRARKEEEVEELRKKIFEAKMPENTEKKALDELTRYNQTSSMMAESGIIKAYLDFLVDVPWYKTSQDRSDLKKVKEILDHNHYGLEKVKERIIEYLSVQIMTKKNPQTILCLVGPPGVGKTSLAISIAEALQRKFVKQSLGGVRDEAEIRGHRRTYIGAMPGRILKSMKDAGTMNPVFLLDEIDKMASDYKGDPASAMLEVLDPEQNYRFSDHYLEEPYDLSKVLFITTANYLENIPGPLRDRMEIVELSSYTEQEKAKIARLYLLPLNLEKHGITEEQFTITDEAIMHLIQYYTREAGVRELDRLIGSLIRKSIKKILIEKIDKIEIVKSNVADFLGKDKYLHNLADKQDSIGAVTGLAYTAYGGDTLQVEVNYYKGKGGLVLTGNLGDVMKESAQTALSFIKAKAQDFGIDPNIFSENDFHIHVPEGAVPKDGPSAGITIATAIYSAVTKKLVRKDVGMTGEITLRGHILPIGGLREKAIAALRSGLKLILIPSENKRDLDEVPVEVKEKLKIVPVKTIDEVFQKALK